MPAPIDTIADVYHGGQLRLHGAHGVWAASYRHERLARAPKRQQALGARGGHVATMQRILACGDACMGGGRAPQLCGRAQARSQPAPATASTVKPSLAKLSIRWGPSWSPFGPQLCSSWRFQLGGSSQLGASWL